MGAKANFEAYLEIPSRYALNLAKKNNIKEIETEISDLASKLGRPKEQVTYGFVRRLLSNETKIFFSMTEDVRDHFLFIAIKWSSAIETKKKLRPKKMSEIPSEKSKDLFTKLQKDLVLAIFNEYKDKQFYLSIEIAKYLKAFYELSCIKRQRPRVDL